MDIETQNNLYAIYNSAIAGSFPVGDSMDVEKSLDYITTDILDTSRVHRYYEVIEGHVYYMAVPSKSLASIGDFKTPLITAFPSSVEHRGDGCYVYVFGEYSAAIIKRENTVKLLASYTSEVLDATAAEGLALYTLDQSSQETRLTSPSWIYRNLSTKTANVISGVAAGVALTCAMAMLASQAIVGLASGDSKQSQQSLVASANDVIKSAQMVSPLVQQIDRINALSAIVVKSGGWIDGYESDKNGERFVLSLPGWTSPDTVADLGPGVRTELQPSQNIIWAIKYNAAGEGIKDMGPTGLLAPVTTGVAQPPAAAQAAKPSGNPLTEIAGSVSDIKKGVSELSNMAPKPGR